MKKTGILLATAIVIGTVTGVSVAHLGEVDEREEGKYCQKIEEGIRGNMSQGFVNCLTPESYSVNLSEKVRENSDLRCVCRKKVGDSIQVLKITVSQ